MGLYVFDLGERECHFVEQMTRKTVKKDRASVDSAISKLNKHQSILGICFHPGGLFGVLEVKSARNQTSRRIETRVWVAEAVKQVLVWAAGIDRMAELSY